jgi:hypothetical protein
VEDVKHTGKRGYVYSYNKVRLTPEQIANIEATQAKGGTRGYARSGSGRRSSGGGHVGGGKGGKAGKVKAIKVKKPKATKKTTVPTEAAFLTQPEQKAPAPIVQMGAPGAKAPSSLSAIANAVNAGAGLKVKGAKATHPASPTAHAGTAMPPEMASQLRSIVANFLAQRGGPSPENLAALRAMLERSGAMSPEILAIISQVAGASRG